MGCGAEMSPWASQPQARCQGAPKAAALLPHPQGLDPPPEDLVYPSLVQLTCRKVF